ncbi:MAG: hypothetical protein ACRD3G_27830 [Vicinamibacterales bacterium]
MPDNDNMEPMLRDALDSVNVARRWRLIGIASVFFAVTLVLWVLSMLLGPAIQPPAGAALPEVTQGATAARMPLKALFVASVVEMFLIACGTGAVILHVSKMTRVILRAIEASRR